MSEQIVIVKNKPVKIKDRRVYKIGKISVTKEQWCDPRNESYVLAVLHDNIHKFVNKNVVSTSVKKNSSFSILKRIDKCLDYPDIIEVLKKYGGNVDILLDSFIKMLSREQVEDKFKPLILERLASA